MKMSNTASGELKNSSKRLLIIGAGELAKKIAREIVNHSNPRYEVVGFIDDDPDMHSTDNIPILGGRDDLTRIVRDYEINEIIIAYAPTWQDKLMKTLIPNAKSELQVKIVPSLYEARISGPKFVQVGDLPMLSLTAQPMPKWRQLIKRIMDIAISFTVLLLFSPTLLLMAISIKLSSRGPILFLQERVGKDGNIFTMYKFRTMVKDAEKDTGPVLASPEDERVTLIGRFLRKTRLDEFPQFINVLKGEMTLVGPRPERPVFVENYAKGIPAYGERYIVKPGITGFAQVYGNYLTTVRDKLRYDLMYIYNQSIFLDLEILLKSLMVVFTAKGT